jgi:hypothetical protein
MVPFTRPVDRRNSNIPNMQIQIPMLFTAVLALAACNGGSGGNSPSGDSSQMSVGADSMRSMADSSMAINPLPEIPAGAKVFFKNLRNGQVVHSPLKVEMGLEGMRLDTAGAVVAGTGHHHLLIDAGDSIAAGQVVPKDSTHLHFGKAQSSAEIKLAPGNHLLTLQFADGIHRSYGGRLTASITVEVKK